MGGRRGWAPGAVHRCGPRRLRTVVGDCSFPFTSLRRARSQETKETAVGTTRAGQCCWDCVVQLSVVLVCALVLFAWHCSLSYQCRRWAVSLGFAWVQACSGSSRREVLGPAALTTSSVGLPARTATRVRTGMQSRRAKKVCAVLMSTPVAISPQAFV